MKKILLLILFVIPTILAAQEMRWERIKPISAQVEMTNPLSDDMILIQEAATGLRKYVKITNLPHPAETDPLYSAWDKDYTDLINKPTIPTNNSQLSNGAGYLTSFTETDPLYSAWNKSYNDLINRPTTISGTQASAIVSNTAKVSFPGFGTLLSNYGFTDNSTNWNTAYDHTSLPNNPHETGLSNLDDYTTTNAITVGGTGLGGYTPSSTNDINTYLNTGFHQANSTAPNNPSGGNVGIITNSYGASRATQIATDVFSNNLWYRSFATTWQPWVKLYHTGNLPTAPVTSVNSLTGDVLIGLSNLNDYTTTQTVTVGSLHTSSGSFEPLILTRTGATENLQIKMTHAVGTRYLGMDSNLDLKWGDATNSIGNDLIYHSGNLTNVSQLANDAGYLNDADEMLFNDKGRLITDASDMDDFIDVQSGKYGTSVTPINMPSGAGSYGTVLNLRNMDVGTQTYYDRIYNDMYIRSWGSYGATISDWDKIYSSGNVNLSTIDWTTKSLIAHGAVVSDELRTRTGQQLVLNAGESYLQATGQATEKVFLNAESGIEINSSPDNWATGWATRHTTTINDQYGNSIFANNVTVGNHTYTVGLSSSSDVYLTALTPSIRFQSSGATNTWRQFQSASNFYIEPETGNDGTFYIRNLANAAVFSVTTSNGTTVAGGDLHSNGSYYYGDGKGVIGYYDDWLRLNPTGHFASGIYCGASLLRTDGNLQVGGSAQVLLTAAGVGTFAGKVSHAYGTAAGNSATMQNLWDSESAQTLQTVVENGGTSTNHINATGGAYFRAINGADYAELQYYGVQFNRSTNYLRPTTDGDKNLNIGYTGVFWNQVNINADAVHIDSDVEVEGLLTVNTNGATRGLVLNRPSTGDEAFISFRTNTAEKWLFGLDNTADNDLWLYTHQGAGYVMNADGATGDVYFYHDLTANTLDGHAVTYYDQRAYNAPSNYLGGGYVSGGLEKPDWIGFGRGKLKLQMLRGGGTNTGAPDSWNDALWLSSYEGTDVKKSTVILAGKGTTPNIGFSTQDWDATDWGTYYEFYHTGNSNLSTVDWAAQNITASGLTTTVGVASTGDIKISKASPTLNLEVVAAPAYNVSLAALHSNYLLKLTAGTHTIMTTEGYTTPTKTHLYANNAIALTLGTTGGTFAGDAIAEHLYALDLYSTKTVTGWLINQASGSNRGLYYNTTDTQWQWFENGGIVAYLDKSGNAQYDGSVIHLDGVNGNESATMNNLWGYITPSDYVTKTGADVISGQKTFTSGSNLFNGHHSFSAYDAAGNHYPHYKSGTDNTGAIVNTRIYNSATTYDTFKISGKTQEITWNGYMNLTKDGSRVQFGAGSGRGGAIGSKFQNDAASNDYSTYWAYDSYWDESANKWNAMRTTLSNKFMQKMGYHVNGVSWNVFTGDAATPWNDTDWDEFMKYTLNVGLEVKHKLTVGSTGTDGRIDFKRTSDGSVTGQIYMSNYDLNIQNSSGSGDIRLTPNASTGQVIISATGVTRMVAHGTGVTINGDIDTGNLTGTFNSQAASYYDHRNAGLETTTGVNTTDLNTADAAMFYKYYNSVANIPNADYGVALTIPYSANYSMQLAGSINAEDLYLRNVRNGVFKPWHKLWHEGNSNLSTVDWTASNLIGATLSNVAPSTDQAKLNGYGLLGNRSALYITNKVGGSIALGVGGTHATNTIVLVDSNGATVSGNVSISGTPINGNHLVDIDWINANVATSDASITSVYLSGTNLNLLGVNGAFNGAVDLSSLSGASLWNESVGYNMVYPKSARKVVSGDYADGAYMDGIAPLIADFGIVSDGNDFVNIRFNQNNGTIGTTIFGNVAMPDLTFGGEYYLLGITSEGEVVETDPDDYIAYVSDMYLQGDILYIDAVGEAMGSEGETTINFSGVSSDFRLKKNFRTLNNSLDKILAINTYAFDWIEKDSIPRIAEDVELNVELDTDSEKRESAGVIAQELLEIIPEAVIQSEDGYYRIKTDAIVPHLVEAMKTQQSQLSEQQKQIDELKKQIERL